MKISVVIRTLKQNPPVLKSIPNDKNIEIIISRWKPTDFDEKRKASKTVEGMAVGRNDGAVQATGDILVLVDDDLQFSKEFFYKTINLCKPGVVVGLENPWQHFMIGRYIVIRREDFFRVGAVNPFMLYHEDLYTHYALERMGYKLVFFNQNNVKCLDRPGKRKDKNYYKLSQFLFHFLRIQLALLLMFPHQHSKRFLRCIIDFWLEWFRTRFY